MTESENIKLADAKIGAILNTASGSCSPESLSEIEAIFAEYALTPVKIWCVDSSELSDALDDFKRQNLDVLIILGGDGTIRSAAERCTAAGPYLIPLPGGTMNILPKALYGDLPWKDALRATLQAPQIKDISAGEVAGKRFFISAVCGAPALWAEAREAIREGEYGQALALGKIALENMFDSKVHYAFNEMHEGKAEAVVITCPLVSSALDDDRHVFEAAVVDVNHLGDVLLLASAAAFGKWRDDNHIAVVRTKSVKIHSDKTIPMILDGETIDAGKDVEITFLAEACRAIVPMPQENKA